MTNPSCPVRPCPLCGSDLKIDRFYARCTNRKCDIEKKKESFENAYCWKELDRSQAEAAKLREALEDIFLHSDDPFTGEKWLRYCQEVAKEALDGK